MSEFATELNAEGEVEASGVKDAFGGTRAFTPQELAGFQAEHDAEQAAQHPEPEWGGAAAEAYADEQLNATIDAKIQALAQEQAAELARAYGSDQPMAYYGGQAEPIETMADVVGDALDATSASPEVEQAQEKLLAEHPEIGHELAEEAVLPVLEQIAEERGLQVALHPETIQAVYQALDAERGLTAQIEEAEIKEGIVGANPYGKDAFS